MSTIAKYVENFPSHQTSRQLSLGHVQNTSLVVGASIAGLFLANLLNNKPKPRPRLENHHMCGITTGGMEECYYSCELRAAPEYVREQVVRNPACLLNCGDQIHPCIRSLVEDINNNGMCRNNIAEFDEVFISEDCVHRDNDAIYPITIGTCSRRTEDALLQIECLQAIARQPNHVTNSILFLIRDSCRDDVYDSYRISIRGQWDECIFDCDLADHPTYVNDEFKLLKNPACLLDCGHIHPCITALATDVIKNGLCRQSKPGGWDWEFDGLYITEECTFEDYKIMNGTCSKMTETLLTQPACEQALKEQPFHVIASVDLLIRDSCSWDVYYNFPFPRYLLMNEMKY